MNPHPAPSARPRGQAAFTMVEIALSLAIIGFALVAIIHILPFGMTVQKENREETIINQDGTYWLEAISTGARGLNELPLYIIAITNYVTDYNASGSPAGQYALGFTPTTGDLGINLSSGETIIGLLSTPKFELQKQGAYRSNSVVAFVRAINGSAVDKPPQSNPDVLDTAFSYRMSVEMVPRNFLPMADRGPTTSNLVYNLYDLRLNFRWPLRPNGDTGLNHQSFRQALGGQMQVVPDNKANLYFFQPNRYTRSP